MIAGTLSKTGVRRDVRRIFGSADNRKLPSANICPQECSIVSNGCAAADKGAFSVSASPPILRTHLQHSRRVRKCPQRFSIFFAAINSSGSRLIPLRRGWRGRACSVGRSMTDRHLSSVAGGDAQFQVSPGGNMTARHLSSVTGPRNPNIRLRLIRICIRWLPMCGTRRYAALIGNAGTRASRTPPGSADWFSGTWARWPLSNSATGVLVFGRPRRSGWWWRTLLVLRSSPLAPFPFPPRCNPARQRRAIPTLWPQ